MSFRGDKHSAHVPAIVSLLVAAACALVVLLQWNADTSISGFEIAQGYRYLQIGNTSLSLSLRIDTLCLTLLTVVTSISAMIAIYSKGYMHDDPGYARYFAVFCGFVFSMTMLVLSHNLLMMYAFWEGVGRDQSLLGQSRCRHRISLWDFDARLRDRAYRRRGRSRLVCKT
jgi:NADH-quinone oxidoreductase subunit L